MCSNIASLINSHGSPLVIRSDALSLPTAVAIDRDKHTHYAVRLAIENLLPPNANLLLIHVTNRNSQQCTPLLYFIINIYSPPLCALHLFIFVLAKELHQWKKEEARRFEQARLAEEAAFAIVEKENTRSKAALDVAEKAQKIS
ncbi:kinase with adenine nucleotide alpha hydrolases-like domain-containing protein [Actinidia rufa]|uniref:Kinase with adenine nucleotide alpha hydrolases-like domain-containing protein n=1 Tax=Actinidia rufa TaxID=165716 RepID=A0A7J0GXL3_9ERIC|nr:kinase with adenine nucleotide alpha hydrolases-like domain-containing protein [Actinidia rufa]